MATGIAITSAIFVILKQSQRETCRGHSPLILLIKLAFFGRLCQKLYYLAF
jgi:hypothetical protein